MPEAFCWTKYGDESGERPDSIFCRKEVERERNGGVFLWGIGQSIRPSLGALLRATSSPVVLFSPMKSQPAERDVAPSDVVLWCDATGHDGSQYTLPDYSLVTSRFAGAASRMYHFALVCESASPIVGQGDFVARLMLDELRNLVSGSVLGSSQVTSVVRRVSTDSESGPQ